MYRPVSATVNKSFKPTPTSGSRRAFTIPEAQAGGLGTNGRPTWPECMPAGCWMAHAEMLWRMREKPTSV